VSAPGPLALSLSLPGAARMAETAAWVRSVHARADGSRRQPLAFLVVTPLGMRDRRWIARLFTELGVRFHARVPLPGWSRVSTAIRVHRPDPDRARLVRATLYEEAWEAVAPGGAGEALAFDPARDHARIARAKRSIRDGLPALDVDFGLGGLPPRRLTAFHVAEAGDAEAEARRLLAALALRSAGAPHHAPPDPAREIHRFHGPSARSLVRRAGENANMYPTMRMQAVDATQRKRYLDALTALAGAVLGEVRANEPDPDDVLDLALTEVHRLEREAATEHAWIFRDPAVLLLSDRLFDALEERPDGRREWMHADLRSAVAAVARHDLMVEIVDRLADEADDGEPGDVAEIGEA
jgi:hypothetical protein